MTPHTQTVLHDVKKLFEDIQRDIKPFESGISHYEISLAGLIKYFANFVALTIQDYFISITFDVTKVWGEKNGTLSKIGH